MKRFGEEEGKLKYIETWDKIMSRRQTSGVSKSSQLLFNLLDHVNVDKTYYHSKNKEFNVFCNIGTQNIYFYDYVDTKAKKIIEYNGDYWHKNPDSYGVEYQHVWDADKRKQDHAKKLGYDVMVVWESEYKKNKEEILERCNEFLRS